MASPEHGKEGRSNVMKAAEWDARYAKGRMWSVEPNRFFAQVVDGLEPGTAIDLACGEGRNAVWLAQNSWTATGVDFSSVAVERGRAGAAELGIAVEWLVADLTQWDPGDRQWDLVGHVYLHLPTSAHESLLNRAASWVAPGGHLVVVGHDRTNIEHGHGGPQDPDVLTTPIELRASLEAAGLTVKRAETVLRPVTVTDDDGAERLVDAIDHVVVAQRA